MIFGGSERVSRPTVFLGYERGRRHGRIVRRIYGLSPADVDDRCTKCRGPIFTQSSNRVELRSKHVDNTPKLAHETCPKQVAR